MVNFLIMDNALRFGSRAVHPHGEDSGARASSMVWLVRLLRRDCWPEFWKILFNSAGGALNGNAHMPCLSLLLAGKFFSSRLELGIIRDGFRH
jgi:hypothetical protein